MGEPLDNYDSVTAAANIMTQADAPGLRLSANRYHSHATCNIMLYISDTVYHYYLCGIVFVN
jgi:adenine C2-methylase RlmN of 23S rRNA A2503 and tRNA A37